MNDSNSEKKEIQLLFEGLDFIPLEILEAVKITIFAERRKHRFGLETFKDLIQICLLEVWAKEDKFAVKPPEYFGRIVKNKVNDYCRQRVRMFRLAADVERTSANEIDIMNDVLCQGYTKRELDDLIHTLLDDDEAAVICLSFFEGFSTQQISVRLNMGLSTVKRRRAEAILKLRSRLRPVVFQLDERLGVAERLGLNEEARS